MEKNRKEKLLKIYDEVAEDNFYYANLEDYQKEIKHSYEFFINGATSQEEQIQNVIKSLKKNRAVVYLGVKESLLNNDYSYLDRALNTYKKNYMLRVLQSGYDHCIATWNITLAVMVLNTFDDFQTVYPKNCGLSKNGMTFLKVATNLIMYLYYKEESWIDTIIKETEKYLTQKDNIEFKSIVKALYALVNKDFSQFSNELSNICQGRKKTKQFGESKFSKEFSFYSLGLYNFAKYLYPNDVDKILLPSDENFLIDYLQYQQTNCYPIDSYLIEFDNSIPILEKLFSVKVPIISLMKNGRKYEVDYKTYNEELVKRVMEQE